MIAAERATIRHSLEALLGLLAAAILGSIPLWIGAIYPYWFGVTGAFVSDDWGILTQAGRMLEQGPTAWFLAPVEGWYRPLFLAMVAGLQATFGQNAQAFHLASMGMYLLFAVLVGALGWRFSGRRRLGQTASFLFALHPVHAEALLWIASSNEILAAIFVLACLWAYERYARSTESGGRGLGWLAVALLALLAGLMSKEVALFAAAIPLIYWLSLGRRSSRLWPSILGFAACGLVFLLFRLGTGSPYEAETGLLRILQNGAYYVAVELFALPDNLGYPSSLPQWKRMALLPVATTSLAVAGWWIVWRRRAKVIVGALDFPYLALLWAGLALGPVILTATGRTAFLSSVGVCWILAWLVDRLWSADGMQVDGDRSALDFGADTEFDAESESNSWKGLRRDGWLLLACFTAAFTIAAGYRSLAWGAASVKTAVTIDALETAFAKLPADEPVCVLDLPDHLHHAYMFRNAFPALSELRFDGRVVAAELRDPAGPAGLWANSPPVACDGATLLRVSDGAVQVIEND